MLKVNARTRELFLYGGIGLEADGRISSAEFAEGLSQLGAGPVTLRLNSPGGSVTEAFAMLSLLEERPSPVKVMVDGLAASAASLFLTVPGWHRVIGTSAEVMIHEPHSAAIGTADDLREVVEILDDYSAKLAEMYRRVMRLELEAIRSAMKRETYYRGQEAVSVGLADRIGGAVKNDLPPKIAAATRKLERFQASRPWLKLALPVPTGSHPFPKREAATRRHREMAGR
jgi:ATP-dependent Clp protease protease subunit